MSTKIEWATEVWNPIIGCSKVSPGCDHCYAERMAFRQTQMRPGGEYEGVVDTVQHNDGTVHPGGGWDGTTALVESALDKPLHWRKPRRVFVCSMGDLFHETVSVDWLGRVFAVMAACPHHTFMLLTKRPHRMATYLGCAEEQVWQATYRLVGKCRLDWPLKNVWLGVTIEHPDYLWRLDVLRNIPAAVHFASFEPLLADVGNIATHLLSDYDKAAHDPQMTGNECPWNKLDWVICGGESGPGARPMHPDWPRGLRDQCQEWGTQFLMKQWGEWIPGDQLPGKGTLADLGIGNRPECHVWSGGGFSWRVGKHTAGRLLDGRTWDEYPEGKA